MPLFAKSPSLSMHIFPNPAGWWRDERLGGCRWRLFSPWGASSANPVPQINSQPASRALTSSLSLSLPLFLSPPISLCLSARGHCRPHVSFLRQLPACYQQCMSVWQPLRLPVCCSVRPSLLLGFLLFFQSYCLSVCLRPCLSASRFLRPISLHRKAASLSAALPICPTICLSICHLCASLFVCLHVYLLVYLSVHPSVY